MTIRNEDIVMTLAGEALGQAKCDSLRAVLAPMLPPLAGDRQVVTRAQFAAALNVVLFADLLDRVPSAAAYVEEVRTRGETICFDHGAIRTVALLSGDTGALPRGEQAFRRILEPLGYEDAALYPLPALRMTGRAYRHRDFPETIPQFFVSELHVDRFDAVFGAAASRVFGGSRDPLDADAKAVLDRFSASHCVPYADAARILPKIVSAFDRQHDLPTIEDYSTLKEPSKEAAWIATEGNAFNHATDRVANVVQLAEDQRAMGRAMKDKVEFSRTGRVRQTAFRADMVERGFVTATGEERRMMVPGSFYEFISRDIDPETGTLDLSFDSGNATGIFHMTKGA
nr:DUF1338 domain-containing protein [Sphingobium sp.]